MNWKLWLDDLRDPSVEAPTEPGFIWCRDFQQARYYTILWGPPDFMALDHDLGVPVYHHVTGSTTTEDSMRYLRWLESQYPNSCPKYRVHSMNPIGQTRIESFMESWEASLPSEAWKVKHIRPMGASHTGCKLSVDDLLMKKETVADRKENVNCDKCIDFMAMCDQL